jgi:hypothetical protein
MRSLRFTENMEALRIPKGPKSLSSVFTPEKYMAVTPPAKSKTWQLRKAFVVQVTLSAGTLKGMLPVSTRRLVQFVPDSF